MKQFRTTLILLLVAAAFGGYIWFNERGPVGQEGAVELLRTEQNSVATLRLEPATGTGVLLQRSGTQWNATSLAKGKTSGTAVRADDSAVESLLADLALVQTTSVINDGEKRLGEFGLDKPAASLDVNGTAIQFGTKPDFDPTRVYAKVGGKIGLVNSTLLDSALKPLQDWRDKAVLRFKTEEANKVALTVGTAKIEFAKTDDKWGIVAPLQTKADTFKVEGALSSLSTGQVSSWLDDNPKNLATFGLDKPALRVEVNGATLTVGKAVSGGRAAQNSASPAVFVLPDSTFAQWNLLLKEWRDKKIANFTLSDVTSLQVEARGQSKALQKFDEKWGEQGKSGNDELNGAALDVLTSVQTWTAQDFVDQPKAPAEYGLDKPEVTLKLSGKFTATYTVGRKNNKVYVSDGAATYQVAESDLTFLQSGLDRLVGKAKKS